MSLLCSLVLGTPASPSICSADTQCANDSPVCCHGTCAKICMSASPPPSPGLPEEWLREEVPGEPAACTDDSQCRQKYETCCRWNDTIGGYGGEGTCAQVCTLSSVKQSPPPTTPPMQDASPSPSPGLPEEWLREEVPGEPAACTNDSQCRQKYETCCRWNDTIGGYGGEGTCAQVCTLSSVKQSPPPTTPPMQDASAPPSPRTCSAELACPKGDQAAAAYLCFKGRQTSSDTIDATAEKAGLDAIQAI
ncbi:hypothetical protein EMIHUDRAFT_216908 [Emiliania huxleyi CCMP1516]|uniref:WAP domain-containing protein n=2 Tax=Emiliania huxleyi TaxID=2903 RepID=A0A0D3ICT4_EMIH1|nr:hypothetical protein EMIHUDRAFT_216908 [Emiliania huxleyi CCMP1516]EOD09069.1 hypothetical protein EMIHUDRAFT_216908 [Emiliania huxleyi CCMP1516]|eukprot:XP_005761498.1 hypothetical protein EMIHUDRAFT_216908 [Emiliania huxleyi CCMP1516]